MSAHRISGALLTRVVTTLAALGMVACGGGGESGSNGGGGSGAVGGSGGVAGAPMGGAGGLDPNGNPDGDCLTTGEELVKGTNPELADSDADGDDDCKEVACKSDPTNKDERCYKCGWPHGDPGNLVSTGIEVGDVIENIPLVDQCGETIPIWEFASDYQILFMTAVW